MSVAVVLLGDGGPYVPLCSGVASGLTLLGVTDATLVDGPGGSALVLSGWDFDSPRHQQTVVDLVAPGSTASVLHAVADVVLRSGPTGPTRPVRAHPIDLGRRP